MKFTIVIPCYNETKTIRAIVDLVRAAPVDDKEIIVVDDCSRDGTRDLLRAEIAHGWTESFVMRSTRARPRPGCRPSPSRPISRKGTETERVHRRSAAGAMDSAPAIRNREMARLRRDAIT